MKIKNFLFIIIFNLNSFLSLTDNEENIRFAFILSRTGAHSPSKLNQIIKDNNDIAYKDIFGYEWNGENELTSVGKRQQYYLGYRNNLHYKNILYSEIYEPRELLSLASTCNKTIQSSYANLHGLYENKNIILTEKQIQRAIPPLNTNEGYINDKIELDRYNYSLPNNMQIVPVQTFYEKDHTYLLEKVENCPNIKNFYDENESLAKKKREEILNYKSDNNNKSYGEILIEILKDEKIFGQNYDLNYLINNSTFFKIMAETFICDYFEAVDLTKFTKKGINIYKLLQMFEEYFGEISIGGGINNNKDERANKTFDLSQKVNYNLLNSLLDWMKLRIDYDKKKKFNFLLYESPKFILYLSHHESLESLYYFLKENFGLKNAKNSLYVNFTSFIGIELYRKNKDDNEYSEKDFYIKLIYDNAQLGNDIPYSDFYEKIKEKIVSFNEVEEFCKFNEIIVLNSGSNTRKIIGIILISIFPILALFTIFLLFRNRNVNKYNNFPEEVLNE